eukprot:CAMPEP_0178751852 /NCGR_PEP_ID=MMETSP0744-20121128/10744_1 /TAXON_ID=913974 /ORGANISM="Nitzschia punctata, Strain CCMP561" /LENGTH=295 /DNA_ID=CAMNT_0020405519 /DNA_START=64 /DNA_END=951 /DNA_ORIENTATION=+
MGNVAVAWHWYFVSALPKAMLLTLFLVPLSVFRVVEVLVGLERTGRLSISKGFLVDTHWLQFLLPIIGFVFLYSFLGHKEMRFIFPALPILNLGAAVAMSKLARLAFSPQEKKDDDAAKSFSWVALFGFVCGLGCMLLSLCGSLTFVAVSKMNYPGGDALAELASYVQQNYPPKDISPTNAEEIPVVHVHIDVASAMSGVSLFGQRAAQVSTDPYMEWKFSKDGYEEDRSVGQEGFDQFTHLLTEDPNSVKSLVGFHVIRTVQGNPRLSLAERRIVTNDSIFVMERNGWRDEMGN